jgi:hypothetical protein
MAITPTGVPPWLRQNNFSSYGGNVNKRNFASRGLINAKTDVGAEAFSRLAADMAACALTAEFGQFTILCNDSAPAAPTVEYASMMTGLRATSYAGDAPPTGFPSVARNGNGDFTITFVSSYADPYGVTGAFAIKHPNATLHGSTAGEPTVEIVTATTLRVRAFTAAGAAISNARVTVSVGSGQ